MGLSTKPSPVWSFIVTGLPALAPQSARLVLLKHRSSVPLLKPGKGDLTLGRQMKSLLWPRRSSAGDLPVTSRHTVLLAVSLIGYTHPLLSTDFGLQCFEVGSCMAASFTSLGSGKSPSVVTLKLPEQHPGATPHTPPLLLLSLYPLSYLINCVSYHSCYLSYCRECEVGM